MDAIASFASVVALLVLVVPVHELGHYLAGLAVGIPAREMRINLRPQMDDRARLPYAHVALRDEHGWIPPVDWRRYGAAMRRLGVARFPRAFIYTAGGPALEFIYVATAALVLAGPLGQGEIAETFAGWAMVFVAFSVIAPSLARTGDYIVLWYSSWVATIAFVTAVVIGYATLLVTIAGLG